MAVNQARFLAGMSSKDGEKRAHNQLIFAVEARMPTMGLLSGIRLQPHQHVQEMHCTWLSGMNFRQPMGFQTVCWALAQQLLGSHDGIQHLNYEVGRPGAALLRCQSCPGSHGTKLLFTEHLLLTAQVKTHP